MQTASIPTIHITPDLLGQLTIDVFCPGQDKTPNGVLRWLSEHAQINQGFKPSIRSVDLAERFQISRRTLEAYRTGMKVPLHIVWQIAALLTEIAGNASSLVPCSTPSETVSRENANETPCLPGTADKWEDQHQNPARLNEAIKHPIKATATTKNKTSKIKSQPSKPKSTPSSKSRNHSPKKSPPSSKKSKPSSKSRNPSKK